MADQPDGITEAAKKIAWSIWPRLRTPYERRRSSNELWDDLTKRDQQACLDAARAISVPAAKLEHAEEMVRWAEAHSRAAISPVKEPAR